MMQQLYYFISLHDCSSSSASTKSSAPANMAMLAFVYVLLGAMTRSRDVPAFKLTISSRVPARVGLGSSGAFCVTLCAAVLRLAGLINAPSEQVESVTGGGDDPADSSGLAWRVGELCTLERWAMAAESLIHGKSSGLDVAICSRGKFCHSRVKFTLC